VAYIFEPDEATHTQQRAPKRRRVSKKGQTTSAPPETASHFVPLLGGAESPDFVKLREQLYEESWGKIYGQIKVKPPNDRS
jgi:origin recognition complex subunit 3